MDITENVPKRIVFEDENGNVRVQKVVYEWLPTQCKCCKGFGHMTDKCRLKIIPVEIKKQPAVKEWRRVSMGKEVLVETVMQKRIGGEEITNDTEMVTTDQAQDLKVSVAREGNSVVYQGGKENVKNNMVLSRRAGSTVQVTEDTSDRVASLEYPKKSVTQQDGNTSSHFRIGSLVSKVLNPSPSSNV
ncbi:OLC1v1030752C1 [Oldenlandia corymbosa var. corymbosa]|uniref:OLC1v1030752C1 n=1 Tax=Oldenlandia corymbosa var. corymbosa TaxID=529605 RepID=A0AAV1CHJ9_OLDCO|nr:OLC1v1030752C1 [Oldenlandia corymbosa var. corymbosa]